MAGPVLCGLGLKLLFPIGIKLFRTYTSLLKNIQGHDCIWTFAIKYPDWLNKYHGLIDRLVTFDKTAAYIKKHVQVAEKLNKPLVIEEFGIPQDGHAFNPAATTTVRDQYFRLFLEEWQRHKRSNGVVAGLNFWAFAGNGRPKEGQVFWLPGDDYLGDPPMEEQGLNSVFDSDSSTWKLVIKFSLSQ